jgi:hypothetical protein
MWRQCFVLRCVCFVLCVCLLLSFFVSQFMCTCTLVRIQGRECVGEGEKIFIYHCFCLKIARNLSQLYF